MITVANIRSVKPNERAVYIGRPMPRQGLRGSPLGNPYRVGEYSRDEALRLYRDWLDDMLSDDESWAWQEFTRLTELAATGDLTLLCWCSPDACHGDVIKEMIEDTLDQYEVSE